MKEFKNQHSKFKFLKDDLMSLYFSSHIFLLLCLGSLLYQAVVTNLFIFGYHMLQMKLYFVIVKNNHWAVCCINMIYKEFHIFDSLKTSKNQSTLEESTKNLVSFFAAA